jgi:hypothetical protein
MKGEIAEQSEVATKLFSEISKPDAVPKLRKLDLSVITTEQLLCSFLLELPLLRHLVLRHVSLLPLAGLWEFVFQNIAGALRLRASAPLRWKMYLTVYLDRPCNRQHPFRTIVTPCTTTVCVTRKISSISFCAGLSHCHTSVQRSFSATTGAKNTKLEFLECNARGAVDTYIKR